MCIDEELGIPQTGPSLGSKAISSGKAHIDRVAARTSYGTRENGTAELARKPIKPDLIALRETIRIEMAVVTAKAEAQANEASARNTSRIATRQVASSEATSSDLATPSRDRREDEKW